MMKEEELFIKDSINLAITLAMLLKTNLIKN